jgi:hypothetical protein
VVEVCIFFCLIDCLLMDVLLTGYWYIFIWIRLVSFCCQLMNLLVYYYLPDELIRHISVWTSRDEYPFILTSSCHQNYTCLGYSRARDVCVGTKAPATPRHRQVVTANTRTLPESERERERAQGEQWTQSCFLHTVMRSAYGCIPKGFDTRAFALHPITVPQLWGAPGFSAPSRHASLRPWQGSYRRSGQSTTSHITGLPWFYAKPTMICVTENKLMPSLNATTCRYLLTRLQWACFNKSPPNRDQLLSFPAASSFQQTWSSAMALSEYRPTGYQCSHATDQQHHRLQLPW